MDSEDDDYSYDYDDASYGSEDYGPEDDDPMVMESSDNPNAAPTIACT